jgi:hypothetical protein
MPSTLAQESFLPPSCHNQAFSPSFVVSDDVQVLDSSRLDTQGLALVVFPSLLVVPANVCNSGLVHVRSAAPQNLFSICSYPSLEQRSPLSIAATTAIRIFVSAFQASSPIWTISVAPYLHDIESATFQLGVPSSVPTRDRQHECVFLNSASHCATPIYSKTWERRLACSRNIEIKIYLPTLYHNRIQPDHTKP